MSATLLRPLATAPAPAPPSCLNCDAPLLGRFCADCGQRALPPRPTLRELAAEAWGEFVNLDGKVLATLRLLVAQPGRLTVEAVAGRRARYVGPLRLYLLCSLACFFVLGKFPFPRETPRTVAVPSAGVPASCVTLPGATAITRALRAVDCAKDRRPEEFQRARADNRSLLFFIQMPVLAGLLALFFRRRTFVEHLYLSMHFHAVVVLAILAARGALSWSGETGGAALVAATMAALVLHLTLAIRRVYGAGWGATVAKGLAIGWLYLVSTLLGVQIATAITIALL